MKSPWFSLLLCAVAASWVDAATIHVPAESPTVQAAIDAASDGDTILVAPGTYVEQVVINKAVAVRGSGRDRSFIEGTVTIESDGAVFSDFFVTGSGWYTTVLVWCSRPVIERNTIYAARSGYGIYAYTYPYWHPDCKGSASATIQNNYIYGGGNGVSIFYASPLIRNNFIVQNWAAGVSSSYFAFPVILNNTIANNGIAGVFNWAYVAPTLRNNIIAHNGRFGVLNSYSSWSFTPSYNVLFQNQIADHANTSDGQPIFPDATQIYADPALVHVPRWSSLAYYFLSGHVGFESASDARRFTVGNLIQLNLDDFPRVITRITDNLVYFQPRPEHVPVDSGLGWYQPTLVSYLGHNRKLSFDWRLSTGSAAIDACDPDPALADQDGSRNDCGATGGPHADW